MKIKIYIYRCNRYFNFSLQLKIKMSYFSYRYVAPLSIMAYLYVKASRELQSAEGPLAIGNLESSATDMLSRHGSNSGNEMT